MTVRVRAWVVIDADDDEAADRVLAELRDGYDYGTDVESVLIVEQNREAVG